MQKLPVGVVLHHLAAYLRLPDFLKLSQTDRQARSRFRSEEFWLPMLNAAVRERRLDDDDVAGIVETVRSNRPAPELVKGRTLDQLLVTYRRAARAPFVGLQLPFDEALRHAPVLSMHAASPERLSRQHLPDVMPHRVSSGWLFSATRVRASSDDTPAVAVDVNGEAKYVRLQPAERTSNTMFVLSDLVTKVLFVDLACLCLHGCLCCSRSSRSSLSVWLSARFAWRRPRNSLRRDRSTVAARCLLCSSAC